MKIKNVEDNDTKDFRMWRLIRALFRNAPHAYPTSNQNQGSPLTSSRSKQYVGGAALLIEKKIPSEMEVSTPLKTL